MIPLGSALLDTTRDNQRIKKWFDFGKIKFHSNENIKWHCVQLELNWRKTKWKFVVKDI